MPEFMPAVLLVLLHLLYITSPRLLASLSLEHWLCDVYCVCHVC